jgi:hypothetical protein
MALSFALEPPYNANSVEYRYGAVCHGLGGLQAYVHGENGVEVRGHPAITQSCQEANGMTLVDRHLVSSPVWNSREIQVMRASRRFSVSCA